MVVLSGVLNILCGWGDFSHLLVVQFAGAVFVSGAYLYCVCWKVSLGFVTLVHVACDSPPPILGFVAV